MSVNQVIATGLSSTIQKSSKTEINNVPEMTKRVEAVYKRFFNDQKQVNLQEVRMEVSPPAGEADSSEKNLFLTVDFKL